MSSQVREKSLVRLYVEQFLTHRLAKLGLAFILTMLIFGSFAELFCGFLHIDPESQDILSRFTPPDTLHWLGTDEAGRDVLARLIHGSRVSMWVAIISAISSAILGIIIGALAGFRGGLTDSLLMRITDAMLSLPTLPILIILGAIDLGKVPFFGPILGSPSASLIKMIFILVLFSWMTVARLTRSSVLSLKQREFILAARTIGLGPMKIIISEMLPNLLSPVIVATTINTGRAILYEASLSFLGLGIQPPMPSWGNMLTNSREIVYQAPLLAVVPGLLILLVVMSFNLVGDGLQDTLDPKGLKR